MIAKRQGTKLILSLSILLCVGGLINSASAQEVQTIHSESADRAQKNNRELLLDNQIDEIQSTIVSQEEKTNQKIKDLELLITVQRDIINDLKINFKSIADKPLTNGTTFEVWSGILLACVAVIVTVLGVAIAIISFIGGKTIIVASKQISEDTATSEAKKVATNIAKEARTTALSEAKKVSAEEAQKVALEIANKITPEAAEKKLTELVDQGYFNHIILDAVDKIALSNIVDPENYDEDDKNEQV